MSVRSSTVSVIVPTFNSAKYLREAVDSVRAQTFPSTEIIVVDDGSTDDTPAVVRSLGDSVVYIRHAHQGIGATRNRGVAHARGEYLAFLDADDLFVPTKIARQLDHLCRVSGPDISLGRVEEFVAGDLPDQEKRRVSARRGALAGYVVGAMLIARNDFLRVGPFESSWRVGEFADWYLKAVDSGLRTETLPDVVLRRRLHGENVGIREHGSRVDYARILKSALDRRRRAVRPESER